MEAKNGITITDLESKTFLGRKTIERHLDRLVAMNVAYKTN